MLETILDYVVTWALLIGVLGAIVLVGHLGARWEDRRRQAYWRRREWEENPELQAIYARVGFERELERAIAERRPPRISVEAAPRRRRAPPPSVPPVADGAAEVPLVHAARIN